jgi:hypothetical protein
VAESADSLAETGEPKLRRTAIVRPRARELNGDRREAVYYARIIVYRFRRYIKMRS